MGSGAEAPSYIPPVVRHFGLSLDAGVPDGAGLSFVFRPWRWVRASVGAVTNGFAPGIRGGLTFVPFNWAVAPSLTVEAGRFAQGDANGIAARVTGDSGYHSGYLDQVAYGFGSAHLGLEIGNPNRWSIFLHAGYSHVIGTVSSFGAGLSESTGATLQATPLHTQITFPSAKLGFVFFIG
jgi:hypothetical protein